MAVPVMASGMLRPSADKAVGATSGKVTYPSRRVDGLLARPGSKPAPLAAKTVSSARLPGATGATINTTSRAGSTLASSRERIVSDRISAAASSATSPARSARSRSLISTNTTSLVAHARSKAAAMVAGSARRPPGAAASGTARSSATLPAVLPRLSIMASAASR